ncbi:hypothetical protein GLOTRDRAFT_128479 [Gloeophyllum trabeum ATCC 11539]|uniref:BTB domain-containing protein n=1 Tax=Gloeophyllum trabeum (strain ATCC 11539 / FP-39264 / Madison 617) TaxID=670483 RepID=S7RPP9_GLOTA|nr:uncharacterized protein GLOTRDRAFT_128479 [Gloeophyllum trabeum ATCC 11539]EPQ56535.1 hypothetical protein GLOTRDRAFT_128479 [Gloeophyllum trabeum ATCC 11539]
MSTGTMDEGRESVYIVAVDDDMKTHEDHETLEESIAPTRHEEYYLDDGNVILLAGDVLFKLHRSLLKKHSPVFRGMWMMPTSVDHTVPLEGASDDNPIDIHTAARDFERFLWILYPPELGSYRATTVAEWSSIIEQGAKWQVASLKAQAGRKLAQLPMDSVEKVHIWKKYGLTEGREQLLDAYIDLAMRERSFNCAEAIAVGVVNLTRISEARDELHRKTLCRCCYQGKWDAANPKLKMKLEGIVRDVVKKVFQVSEPTLE